jgi:hypothetical protein
MGRRPYLPSPGVISPLSESANAHSSKQQTHQEPKKLLGASFTCDPFSNLLHKIPTFPSLGSSISTPRQICPPEPVRQRASGVMECSFQSRLDAFRHAELPRFCLALPHVQTSNRARTTLTLPYAIHRQLLQFGGINHLSKDHK